MTGFFMDRLHRTPQMLGLGLTLALLCFGSGESLADGSPLVDCSAKKYKSGSSARSLMGWSNRQFAKAQKAVGTGVYPTFPCNEVIRMRGDAHCQKPGDAGIRSKLQAAIKLCHRLKKPAKANKAMLVACKKPEYKKNGTVAQLIRSSRSMSSRLAQWSLIQVKARCKLALEFAGAAHCKLPAHVGARRAYSDVGATCAADMSRRQAKTKAQAEADAKRAAKRKANRKIVSFPRGTFKGGSARALARQMKAAMLKSAAAKSSKEILKVVPMGRWQSGRYRRTKVRFRKVNGMVLWHDKDGDGVCRFATYKFVKDKKRRGYGRVRFQAFCMGCTQGWTKCKARR